MPWGHRRRWNSTSSNAPTAVTGVPGHLPGRSADEGDAVMAMGDRIPTRAEEQQARGRQTVGDATGNDDLKAGGEKDEATGNVKQAGEKIKDVVKN